MSNTREGFPFYGKRDEAVFGAQKAIFASVYRAVYGPLDILKVVGYDELITRLEELAEQGLEEHMSRRYGGREEGM